MSAGDGQKNSFHAAVASLGDIDAICEALRAFLRSRKLEREIFVVELLAREALNNAVLHGNRQQRGRLAQLALRLGTRWLRLEVADQGLGFDWRKARRKPGDSATHGRGLLIDHQYADRVRFNRRGNQIQLWLALQGPAKRYAYAKL